MASQGPKETVSGQVVDLGLPRENLKTSISEIQTNMSDIWTSRPAFREGEGEVRGMMADIVLAAAAGRRNTTRPRPRISTI